jgi:anaerobic selenocysteine-containing dehydrogenase
MKRTAARGEGKFTNVSWDEAIAAAATTLAKVRSANPDGIVFF